MYSRPEQNMNIRILLLCCQIENKHVSHSVWYCCVFLFLPVAFLHTFSLFQTWLCNSHWRMFFMALTLSCMCACMRLFLIHFSNYLSYFTWVSFLLFSCFQSFILSISFWTLHLFHEDFISLYDSFLRHQLINKIVVVSLTNFLHHTVLCMCVCMFALLYYAMSLYYVQFYLPALCFVWNVCNSN